MTEVPLGRGAYKRLYTGAPEVQLQNRWLEVNPANLREGTSVIARPGTTHIIDFNVGSWAGYGSMRGQYALSGLFDDSMFVVAGDTLYRVNQDMSTILISGVISGTGYPEVAWQKGADYERLWISDGLTLQYYDGTSAANGYINVIGTIVNGVDKFQVGGVYYMWGTTFSSSDAGSSAHPFIVNPNPAGGGPANPLAQLVLAMNNTGTAGLDYSYTIGGPNTVVTATLGSTSVTGVTVTNGGTGYTSAPGVTFSSTTGGSGATATATVSGGAVTGVTMADNGDGYTLPPVVTFTGGGGSGAFATAAVGTPTPETIVHFKAKVPGLAGNAITLSVVAGTGLGVSGSVLRDGGIDALTGVAMPDGVAPITLSQVSSYVLVGIADSQKFYWVNPGETVIDPLNFASKESSPDNIQHIRAVGDQVLVIGEKSTENWYATGNLAAPFAPIEGRVYARGAITGTPVVVDDGCFLVGDDGRVYSVGFQPGDGTDAGWGVQRVSNNGIEERIRMQIRREAGLTP